LVREEFKLDQTNITIIDVLDDVIIPEVVREGVYKVYPNARQATLKSGGNFPYLSRADEINMHIEVHLRSVCNIAAISLQNVTEEDIIRAPDDLKTDEDIIRVPDYLKKEKVDHPPNTEEQTSTNN